MASLRELTMTPILMYGKASLSCFKCAICTIESPTASPIGFSNTEVIVDKSTCWDFLRCPNSLAMILFILTKNIE